MIEWVGVRQSDTLKSTLATAFVTWLQYESTGTYTDSLHSLLQHVLLFYAIVNLLLAYVRSTFNMNLWLRCFGTSKSYSASLTGLLNAFIWLDCKPTPTESTRRQPAERNNNIIIWQPGLRVRRPNRVTGCVQAANDSSCTARRVFWGGWAWIGQDRSCRVEATHSNKNLAYNRHILTARIEEKNINTMYNENCTKPTVHVTCSGDTGHTIHNDQCTT